MPDHDSLPPPAAVEASPPAKPRSSRARLIETAALLFHEDGYRHVSLDRILRESGVVRSNFYYHFKSKEDLALAVMDTWLDDLTEAVIGPSLEREDLAPLARVRFMVDGLIDRLEVDHCRGGCPFGTLANAEAEHNDRFRQKLIQTFDGFARVLERLYRDAAERGELPDNAPEPAKLAALTLGFIQGGYLLSKTYADTTPMRLAADGMLSMLGVQTDTPLSE